MFLDFKDFLQKNDKFLMGWLCVVLILVCVIICLKIRKNKRKKINNKTVAMVSIFASLSTVLYFFPKFSLPFFPSFLEINFSIVPILIIGFILGPSEALLVVLIRGIVKLPFTSSFCVGEIADILISSATVLVASNIYLKNKTKKTAFIALIFSSLAWVITGVIANWLIMAPFYISLYCEGNIQVFLGFLKVIPGVNEQNYMIKYLFVAVAPFNLVISIITSTITFLVYKKISTLFNKVRNTTEEEKME